MTRHEIWPVSPRSVNTLFLDALNPRLKKRASTLSQRDIIEDLVSNDDVYGLAKKIVDHGWQQGDLILAVYDKASKKRTVIEGNRRVAALKLINSPDMAPAEYRNRFSRLANRAPDFSKLRLLVQDAPSREAARPHLINRHIGEAAKGWTFANQAKFYSEAKKPRETIKAFCDRIGQTESQARRYLFANRMYELACALDVPDSTREKIEANDFPLTTLMRLLDSQACRDWLGLERTNTGEPNLLVEYPQFEKGFSRIVTDVAERTKVNSRTTNDEEGIREYLQSINSFKPTGKTGTKKKLSSAKKATKKTKKKTSTTRNSRQTALPNTIRCGFDSGRVLAVYEELRSLRIEKHPNACSVLLRSLLEMSMSIYLRDTGQLKSCIAEVKKKRNLKTVSRTFHPSLKEMLTYFCAYDLTLVGNDLKAVKTFMNKQSRTMTLDDLHGIVHDAYSPPSTPDFKNLVDSIEPLLKLLLTPVQKKN